MQLIALVVVNIMLDTPRDMQVGKYAIVNTL